MHFFLRLHRMKKKEGKRRRRDNSHIRTSPSVHLGFLAAILLDSFIPPPGETSPSTSGLAPRALLSGRAGPLHATRLSKSSEKKKEGEALSRLPHRKWKTKSHLLTQHKRRKRDGGLNVCETASAGNRSPTTGKQHANGMQRKQGTRLYTHI